MKQAPPNHGFTQLVWVLVFLLCLILALLGIHLIFAANLQVPGYLLLFTAAMCASCVMHEVR